MESKYDSAIRVIVTHGKAEEAFVEILQYVSPVLAAELVYNFYLHNDCGNDPEDFEDFMKSMAECRRADLS